MSKRERGASSGPSKGTGMVHLRSDGPVFDLDLAFPKMQTYQPSSKLPTLASVMGMLRFHTARGGSGRTKESGVKEVAKVVYAKWYHDTIPCVSMGTLKRKLGELLRLALDGSKRLKDGRESKVVNDYKEIVYGKDHLYDIFPRKANGEEDLEKKKKVEEEWGVTMGKMEELYYEDQRTERKMECGREVDPVWYEAMMRRQRARERLEAYREQRDRQFLYQPISAIEGMLMEDGSLTSSDEESTAAKKARTDPQVSLTENADREGVKARDKEAGKRKKIFDTSIVDESDKMPEKYRYIRKSERKVRDDVYIAVGNLCGEGLSLEEAAKAVVEVGNTLFNRKWKVAKEGDESFDANTMPAKSNIREALRQQEAQDLDLMLDELVKGKEENRPLTHFTDSTTKKGVGQFAAQGIHIGRDAPFPLPILSIDGETTEDVAIQVDMALTLVGTVRGVSSGEVYKLIDTHMTDSTEHNKGLSEVLQEAYDLDKPAGQLFCGSHTTLGLAGAMNKVTRLVEAEMNLDKCVHGFMVDLDVDTKNSSVAGQAADMCLKLVAPEYNAKPWNKNKEFLLYLEERGAQAVLFSYKDSRFGCLSRAAAVLLYHWDHLQDFLSINPSINNRLACLVREVMELPYLKPVLAVYACLGVHLVEPFYAHTISTEATHSKLKLFYISLYHSMEKEVSENFYTFAKPEFEGVKQELLEGVKISYREEVLQGVTEVAREHKDEVIKLASVMLPHLRTVLARQRRDYGIDEKKFPAQYPVEEQAHNIDQTPVHNLAAERACGKIDYRLHKVQHLASVSRQLILQRCKELRDGLTPSFRGYRDAAQAKREVELSWTKSMKEKMKNGSDEKREKALQEERKRLRSLEKLKEEGGPFTSADEVDTFLADMGNADVKAKQQRMKREVQYARDTSTLLPKCDPLFKIRKSDVKGRQRDKTADEFGDSLKVFLGKKGDRQTLEYSTFRDSLEKLVIAS